MKNIRIQEIDVAILCGGLGRRLRYVVDDRPKPMAEMDGRPFLDILIDHVAKYGVTRFILCTGYKGDFIKRYYENKGGRLKFIISEEKKPLGTAGAIKHAELLIGSDPFLILNGDSFCEINLKKFLQFHVRKRALISIALTIMKGPVDYGVIKLDEDQKIIHFNEKVSINGTGFVNTGVYLFDKKILEEIPSGKKRSLEFDLFPKILNKGLYGFITNRRLLDIGTPERLEVARRYFRRDKK